MTALKTEFVEVDAHEPDLDRIRYIAKVIETGGLVVLPTDTVYGLVCDPGNSTAVEGVYLVKRRSRNLPLALLLRDMGQAGSYAGELSDSAVRAMQEFWPGALTVVLRASKDTSPKVRAGKGTIGLRLPAHVVPRLVADELGTALASTSANLSAQPSPITAEQARAHLDGLVHLIVDGGPAPTGQESTVVDFSRTPPQVLREGAVSIARLREVLGEVRVK